MKQNIDTLFLKNKKIGLERSKNPQSFIEFLNNMQDTYKNIDKYNPVKKHKLLIVFDDMIADMASNKNDEIVIELFIRGTKLNISLFLLPNYILQYQKMLH